MSALKSLSALEENINNFKSQLRKRGYPKELTEGILSEVKFQKFVNRVSALKQKQSAQKKLLPFNLSRKIVSERGVSCTVYVSTALMSRNARNGEFGNFDKVLPQH